MTRSERSPRLAHHILSRVASPNRRLARLLAICLLPSVWLVSYVAAPTAAAADLAPVATPRDVPITGAASPADRIAIQIDERAGALTVVIDGRTALVYRFGADVDLPHFDPFNSASGRPMTVKITEPYPHHRSFWVADERVQLEGRSERANIYSALYSGVIDKQRSKWPLAPYRQRSVHVAFENVTSAGDTARFDETLTWQDGDIRLLDELRSYRFRALGDGEYFLDFSVRLRATYGAVTIARDTAHYATPYIRMNDVFNVEKGGGKIVNSAGDVNQAGTNNRLATWVDYSAPLGAARGWEGLACLIHPDQKPPHLWLTRDYGTWGPRGPEGYHNATFTIARGASLAQRVGLLVHRGDAVDGKVAERYRAYATGNL